MDKVDENTLEYGWASQEATHAHSYLLPVVNTALNTAIMKYKLPKDKLKIFDAGCGNGYTAGYFLSKGYEVTGCDASKQGVELASKSYPSGKFQVASVYDDLPEKFGNEWNVILSTEVIEHLYNPRLYAKNLYNILDENGCLIITTPYHGYLKNLAMAVAGKMDSHFTVLWDGGHIKFWSKNTLTTLLTEAGFKVDAFFGAGRFPFLWKSMVLIAVKK